MVKGLETITGGKSMSSRNIAERPDRWPVNLRGFALNESHDSDILVSELSYAGCQFRCDDPFSTGERIELRIIKRGAVQAEVRWSDQGRAGAKFVN
jgi:PilZ domain-containing protein